MSKRGFTLIELLIVVAIIAILAAIAVPNFLEAQVRAKVARTKNDMRTLATACEAYTVDHNKPPISQCDIGYNGNGQVVLPSGLTHDLNTDPTNGQMNGNTTYWLWSFWTTPIAYITSVPQDPFALKGRIDSQTGKPLTSLNGLQYTYYQYITAVKNPTGRIDHTYPVPMKAEMTPMIQASVTWAMYSWGPNLHRTPGGTVGTSPAKLAGNAPSSTSQWLYPDALYDPTNGTLSWGLMMRTNKGIMN